MKNVLFYLPQFYLTYLYWLKINQKLFFSKNIKKINTSNNVEFVAKIIGTF